MFSDGLARATSKAAAGHADWLALKAAADTYATYAVPPYHRDEAPANSINYVWQGTGWEDAILPLSLAYRVTGNTIYSDKVRQIVAVINAAGLAPIQIDQGYPTRSAGFAFAIAYNWTSDAWTAQERADAQATLTAWHEWVKVSANAPNGAENPTGNYFWSHILGMGLGGYAMGLSAVSSHWQNQFDTYIEPTFASGLLQGGFHNEGFNYGPGSWKRLILYMLGVRDLTGSDYFDDKLSRILQGFVDNRRPNRWQFSEEGSWSGATTGLINHDVPTMITAIADAPYDGYAKYFLDSMVPSGTPFYTHAATLFIRVLFEDTSVTPIDYTAVFPRARVSPGDNHLIWRTDWSTSANWISFTGAAAHAQGTVARSAGHLCIQRGTDQVLPGIANWKGTTGIYGAPAPFDDRNWRYNTLVYPLDAGWNATYTGGQGYWGVDDILYSVVTDSYAYMVAELGSAYKFGAGLTNLTRWLRTVVILEDDSVVVRDDIQGSGAKALYWHAPLNAWTLTAAGATSTVGSSKLTVTCKTHSPMFLASDPLSDGDSTPHTSRVETRDSGASVIFLHVLQPTALGATPSTVGAWDGTSITVGDQIVTFTGDAVAVTEVGGGGDELELSADVTLTGAASLSWDGLTVNANGHRIIIPDASWTGTISITDCIVNELGTASLRGIGNAAGTDYGYMNGATLTITGTEFHECGGIHVYTANGAVITFNDNTVHADQALVADEDSQDPWFNEQGTSTAAKSFKRNIFRQSPISLQSPNWTVGGASADANILVGRRVGILPSSTVSGTVSYNYINGNLDVTPQQTFWSQASAVSNIGSGVTFSNNIVGGAHWPINVCDGICNDNVFFHASAHEYMRMGVGGTFARNICLATHPSVSTYPGSYNTMSYAAGAFRVQDVMTFTDTVLDMRGSDAPATNFYTEPGASLIQTGTKRITSGSDTTIEGPLPLGSGQAGVSSNVGQTGFPFNDADILDGTFTVGQLLQYFQWVYGAPTAEAAPAIVSTNKRPMVYAGPSFTIANTGITATLNGYGADDGLPSNVLTFAWSKVSGPGTVNFLSTTDPNTTATFTQSGTYVIRLTATDGTLSSTSDATIVVG
jgi:hypothetical protein